MKRFFAIFAVISFVTLLTVSVQSQVLADGWRVANSIKAGPELFGAWDIITNLDLDHDGNPEFIYSEDPVGSSAFAQKSAGQRVFYYEYVAADSFELRWSFTTPIENKAGAIYSAIAVGDLDSDGLPELYFATPLAVSDSPPNPHGLYVFEFDGTNFPATPSETWGFNRPDNYTFTASGLAIGDVDSDGETELVVQSRGDDASPGGAGRTMMVVNSSGLDIGLGLGAFSVEFEESATHEGGVVYDPRIVDFDGDGHNEIWVFTWDYFSLAIWEATGQNSYELQTEIDKLYEPSDFGHRRGMRFYDANRDGHLEFYTSGIQPDNGPGSAIFYIGSSEDVSQITGDSVVKLGGLNLPSQGSAVGDIDGDSLMDYLFTARDENDKSNMVYRMEYKGAGDLSDSTNYDWNLFFKDEFAFANLRNIAICDLDGDHKTEVMVTNLNALNADKEILYIFESETGTGVAGAGHPVNLVNDFVLNQNYPNPFSAKAGFGYREKPGTFISYNLKKPENVTAVIYNQLGKVVRRLIDRQQSQGLHQIFWDAKSEAGQPVSGGIYFYTIKAGNQLATKTMIVIK